MNKVRSGGNEQVIPGNAQLSVPLMGKLLVFTISDVTLEREDKALHIGEDRTS